MSPVFDVAHRLCVFTVESGAVTGRSDHRLRSEGRIAMMSTLGVDVLICSAISRRLEAALWVAGVEVVREVCGPVDDVVDAYLNGTLAEERLLTPAHSRHTRPPPAAAGTEERDGAPSRQVAAPDDAGADREKPDLTVEDW